MVKLRFSKSDDEKTLYLLKGDIDEEWYGDRYVESHFTSYDKPIKCDLHEFINTSSSEIEHILFAFLRGQDEKYRKMSEEISYSKSKKTSTTRLDISPLVMTVK